MGWPADSAAVLVIAAWVTFRSTTLASEWPPVAEALSAESCTSGLPGSETRLLTCGAAAELTDGSEQAVGDVGLPPGHDAVPVRLDHADEVFDGF